MYGTQTRRTKSRGYRIASKFRFAVFLLSLSLLMFLMGGYVLASNPASALDAQDVITVEVKSGDTIWQIAKKYNESGGDIRKMVFMIGKINNISDGNIIPGQLIKIPVRL